MPYQPKKNAPKKKNGFPAAAPEELDPKALEPALDEAETAPAPGKKAEKPGTPSGIKIADETADKAQEDSEATLNKEIDVNFRLAFDAEREWIEAAKEDIEFKAGNQWSDEDKALLKAQRRPCLTFNKIKAFIKLITGHEIQNSARLQVVPEGGEDQRFSDVADRYLQHVDENSELEFNMGYLFGGGQTTGRGHIELEVSYEDDPIFGRLRTLYHGKPGTIFMDPRGTHYDLNQDREFGFKLVKKTKADLKALYPEAEAKIEEIGMDTENPQVSAGKEGDANNYGASKTSTTIGLNKTSNGALEDPEVGLFHVKEYWRYKRVDCWYVYFVTDGSKPEFKTEEEANAEAEKRKADYLKEGGLPEQWQTIIKKRRKKEMHLAIRCGGVILADGISPHEPYYSGYPFFQFLADWTPEAENMKDAVQGLVRCLKDPQREKNKSRSQFLHIINTAANAGWIADEDALKPHEFEELKQFGSTPGIIIKKKAQSQLTRIEPTSTPVAQQVREKAASDDFKEVSGLNADLLAVDDSANPSGKAIALRIRQGLTILEPDFRNFRYTKKLIGHAIMRMAPSQTDVAKLKKILGERYMAQNGIDGVFLKSFLIAIEDLKYNVRIAERGDTKSNREETFEDLMQMMEKGMQFPFEVLAEFMTIPNKTELIQKVQAYQAQQLQQAALAAGAGAPGPKGNKPGRAGAPPAR